MVLEQETFEHPVYDCKKRCVGIMSQSVLVYSIKMNNMATGIRQ